MTRKTIGHRFAIRWEGSVLAPETGDYEFIVRTEHSARLWVNDLKKPLIDRWVKSGNDTEFRESILLLGGRVYPLRLEFSKGKQGVKDGKKDPDPPPDEGVRRPALEAARADRRGDPPAVPVAGKGPRDRSSSRRRSRRTTGASATSAGRRSRRPGTRRRPTRRSRSPTTSRPTSTSWPGVKDDAKRPRGEASRLLPQVRRAGVPPAAVRRAEGVLRRSPVQGRQDPDAAVKRVVLLVLKSPRFLYHELGGQAGRLRRGLPALVRALGFAARPGPARRRGRPASWPPASRSPRRPSGWSPTCGPARKVREFLLQWLKVDRAADISKDPQAVPRVQPGDRLGPADVARPVPRRRGLGRVVRLPPAPAGRRPLPERPAGAVLRRQPARRRAVPEGEARSSRSGPGC